MRHLVAKFIIQHVIVIQHTIPSPEKPVHALGKTLCRLSFRFHGLVVEQTAQHLDRLPHKHKLGVCQVGLHHLAQFLYHYLVQELFNPFDLFLSFHRIRPKLRQIIEIRKWRFLYKFAANLESHDFHKQYD